MVILSNTMNAEPDKNVDQEIPSLGLADGRPINKKKLFIFTIVLVTFASVIFFILSKIKSRNVDVVAKPEAEQTVALPAERERLVPPVVQSAALTDSTGVQRHGNGNGSILEDDKTNSAVHLTSELSVETEKMNSLQNGQSQNANASGITTTPLIEKRSKLGGSLMVEDSAVGAASKETHQTESIVKKRLQPIGTQGGERSDSSGLMNVLDTALSGGGGGAARPVESSSNSLGNSSQSDPASNGSNISSTQSLQSGIGQTATTRTKNANIIEAQRMTTDKNYVVPRGSNINCAMDSRLVSDVSGQTSCTVSINVYSMNGAYRLIPKGSRLTGTYKGGTGDNDRLAIIWDRILTPSGVDVSISDPGTDAMGGAGIPGEFNGHWFKKLSTAIMVSLAGDIFKLGAVKYGPTTSTTTIDSATGLKTEIKTPFESITVDTLSTIPGQITAKTLATPGTVTIMQGQLINVITTRDIDFRQVTASL